MDEMGSAAIRLGPATTLQSHLLLRYFRLSAKIHFEVVGGIPLDII